MAELKCALDRLNDRMQELAHKAKKSLGQNFLVADHVIQKITDAAARTKSESVVEIGPGLGAITDLLIRNHKDYTAIELDHGLAEYWTESGLKVIEGDALQIDWSQIHSPLLVSNLPYQISSSIVIEKSIEPFSLKFMILMFQKEVAQRIRAKEKTDEYGMLSVIAQEFWDIETVSEAGPKDFRPPPKVASRVLGFKRRSSDIDDPKKYLSFIKRCFQQRRRILKSNLMDSEKDLLMKWIEKNKLSDKVRAEELSPAKLKDLYFYLTGQS